MIEEPTRPDRSATGFLPPAGPRLPARLRSRRALVVPPVLGAADRRG